MQKNDISSLQEKRKSCPNCVQGGGGGGAIWALPKRKGIFGIPSLIVFKAQKTFVERITLQIVQTMVGVTGELMRCHLCKCMLPTSISQKQFLHHVQVAYYCDFFPQAKNDLRHLHVHVTFLAVQDSSIGDLVTD